MTRGVDRMIPKMFKLEVEMVVATDVLKRLDSTCTYMAQQCNDVASKKATTCS